MNKAKKLQVVTGGTAGMGLATAKALSVYGPVLIGGRSEKRLEGALAELKEAGVEAYGKPCDVSSPESLKAFVEYALTIAPGSFYTPMLAGGNDEAMRASIKRGTVYQRFGTSEEMADLIVHLLAPGHGYLTGVDIIHDGGKTALSFAKQMM